MQVLPEDVAGATRQHLDAVDAAAPGLIRALYVTGSVALGDYHPGRSDIDFMAFTARPLTDEDVAMLREVHASLTAPKHYDGNYVGWHELPHVPDDEPPRPHLVDGELRTDDCHELTPSTWTEFRQYAIAVRGPAASALRVSITRQRLHEWNLGNLNGYWDGWASAAASYLERRDPAAILDDAEVVCWGALGAARLHYTLATGDITSKSGAGRYALEHFGAYENVITAALAWRATGNGEFTHAMALDSAELVRAIVKDANQRWGPQGNAAISASRMA